MDAFPLSSDLLGKSASAYEHLRRAVSRGQLRPGRRLSATGLAAAFRISETPVREALLRLSAEGFIAWEPNKGHFTKPVTLAEQADLHEIIAISLAGCLGRAEDASAPLLEALAAAAASANASPPDAPEAVDQAIQLLDDLGAALMARSGNQVLAAIMSIISDRVWLVRRLDLASPERIGQVRARVAGVAAAVRGGDDAAAREILIAKLAERRRRLPELVAAANLVAAQSSYP